MFDSIFFVRKLNEAENVSLIEAQAKDIAREHGLIDLVSEYGCDDGTLIMALGGDGTMLEAMRVAARYNSTAMGVNLGRIGFLTDFEGYKDTSAAIGNAEIFAKKFTNVLEDIDQFPIEERILVFLKSEHTQTIACNEVTVSSDKSDTMITYHLYVDDYEAGTHRANSILVATPTGSTAYSLSAGGSLMMPDMKALQIVPVAPSTLTSRPILVGQTAKIVIEAWGGSISVRRDGTTWYTSETVHTSTNPYRVQVKASSHFVKILHNRGWNFFDVLSNKLGWQKDE